MYEKIVMKIAVCFIGIIAVLTFAFINRIIRVEQLEKNVNKVINKGLQKSRKGYLSYERIQKYLIKKGNPFHMTPASFLITKILCSVSILICFNKKYSVWVVFASAVLAFFIVDLLINLNNIQENKKMISDISNVHDCLRIQCVGGVHITNALAECYLVSRFPRMKKALLELNAEILLDKNIETAIDTFNSKFDFAYINAFCITIKQSCITGQSQKALEDLSQEIKEGVEIADEAQADKEGDSYTLLQIFVFAGIMAMVVFIFMSEIKSSFIMFS